MEEKSTEDFTGQEIATGRKVAIKKIKVGAFKDGLDMSAIREVKFLQELHHPNILEVSPVAASAFWFHLTIAQLLDVFSTKTNLNLVLEFLDTDLEIVIKDRSIYFLPADIKSWMAMTLRGLEFCHRNSVLHRVSRSHDSPSPGFLNAGFRISNPTICSSLRMANSNSLTLALRGTMATLKRR